MFGGYSQKPFKLKKLNFTLNLCDGLVKVMLTFLTLQIYYKLYRHMPAFVLEEPHIQFTFAYMEFKIWVCISNFKLNFENFKFNFKFNLTTQI